MSGLDTALIVLRVFVYVGSIGTAGGVLFALSFPRATADVQDAVRRQIVAGCVLLLLVEPARAVVLQLAMAAGDPTLAFGAEMRWMAFQMPAGQAAAARVVAALALLALGWRSTPIRITAALAMIGSFLVEGHTASAEARSTLTTIALLVHLVAVHWWLGSLYPLLATTGRSGTVALADTVETFGRIALWVVAGLVAAGALLLAILTGWTLRIESAYQLRFLLKLALVAGLLSLAAWNKLRLTPLLRRDRQAGAPALGGSIRMEIAAGLLILTATAWAITTAPDE